MPKAWAHVTPRNIGRIEIKIKRMNMKDLKKKTFKDGIYKADEYGYSNILKGTVTIKSGKIKDFSLVHQEKAHLQSVTIVPQAIIKNQSIEVDAIAGATVTSDAICSIGFKCLMKAMKK